MAVYSTDFSDPLAVERWSGILEEETLPQTLKGVLVGKSAQSALRVKNELHDDVGGKIVRVPYMAINNDNPIRGNTTIEGNESSHSYSYDDIEINVERFAFRSKTTLADQFILQSFRKDMKTQARKRWVEYCDESVLNQLAGNTLVTPDTSGDIGGADSSFAAGNNPVTAPTANNHILADAASAGHTAESDLVAGDNMVADLIYQAVEQAETLRTENDQPNITEASLPVGVGFWCVMTPRQWRHLREASGQFLDLVLAEVQGGRQEDNVLRKRFVNKRYQYLGQLDGTHLFKSPYLPKGISGSSKLSSVDRAVFGGAQSGWVVYGKRTGSDNRMIWVEEEFDYEEEYGVVSKMIWGVKKAVVDSADLGTIVLSTHRDTA